MTDIESHKLDADNTARSTHRTCGVYLPQPRTLARADEIVDGRGGPAVGAMDCDEHPSASSARHSRAPTIKLLSWQHAWPPAWSWRRKWARCAAARCRCSLNSPAAFCRTVRCHLTTTEGRGRVTPNPLDTTTFEESNVRASEAMPGGMVSVISRTGSASSQKTSPISKEPPQQHAPAGAVSASRSSATGRTCQTELRCGPDPMQLLAHFESVGLVLQAR